MTLHMIPRYRVTALVVPLTIAVVIAVTPDVVWDYARAFLIASAAILAVTTIRRAFPGVPSDHPRRRRERRAANRWGAVSYALFCAMLIVVLIRYLGDQPHVESLIVGAAAVLTGAIANFRDTRRRV